MTPPKKPFLERLLYSFYGLSEQAKRDEYVQQEIHRIASHAAVLYQCYVIFLIPVVTVSVYLPIDKAMWIQSFVAINLMFFNGVMYYTLFELKKIGLDRIELLPQDYRAYILNYKKKTILCSVVGFLYVFLQVICLCPGPLWRNCLQLGIPGAILMISVSIVGYRKSLKKITIVTDEQED